MSVASKKYFAEADAGILCAAVADFRPEVVADKKIKREKEEELTLHLQATEDIAASLGALKGKNQLLVGFASKRTMNSRMPKESSNARTSTSLYLIRSMMREPDYRYDTNKISIIDRKGRTDYPLKSKTEVAQDIIDRLSDELKLLTLNP